MTSPGFDPFWDERKLRKRGEPYDFQIFAIDPKDHPGKNKDELKAIAEKELLDRLKKLYEEGRKKDPEVSVRASLGRQTETDTQT